jgi:stage II sporulation protein GA (sporulation sigma-E factor processing peptidase)
MKVVYLDLVFLINAGMDFLLLYLTGKVWGRSGRKRQIFLAALAGGVWAGFVTVNSLLPSPVLPEWLGVLLTWTAVSLGMLKISFRVKGFSAVKYLVTLYGMTFLVGGCVDAVYYHSSLGAYLRDRLYGGGDRSVPIAVLAAGVLLTAAGFVLVMRVLLPRLKEPDIRTVCLEFRGRSIPLKGLYDTGNRLQDPYFGNPVHVVELDACRGLLSEKEMAYIESMVRGKPEESPLPLLPLLSIPYRSVGESNGILPALFMDELRLEGDNPIRVVRPLIGFAGDPLNQDRQYQMILHPITGRTKKTGGRREHDFKGIDAGPISMEDDAGVTQSDASPSGRRALYRGQ